MNPSMDQNTPPTNVKENTWEWWVYRELGRISEIQNVMNDKVTKIQIEIATLKVKAGVWGVVGAAIPVVIMLGLQFLMKKGGN